MHGHQPLKASFSSAFKGFVLISLSRLRLVIEQNRYTYTRAKFIATLIFSLWFPCMLFYVSRTQQVQRSLLQHPTRG